MEHEYLQIACAMKMWRIGYEAQNGTEEAAGLLLAINAIEYP